MNSQARQIFRSGRVAGSHPGECAATAPLETSQDTITMQDTDTATLIHEQTSAGPYRHRPTRPAVACLTGLPDTNPTGVES